MAERTSLSLRLTAGEREALEALKTCLVEPVASRAILTAIRLYPAQHQAPQSTLDGLAQARADRARRLQAVADTEGARPGLVNTAAEIAGSDARPDDPGLQRYGD